MATAREMRLRRSAQRQGHELHRCRVRNPDHPDFGLYAVFAPSVGGYLAPPGVTGAFGLTLDEVEEWLS